MKKQISKIIDELEIKTGIKQSGIIVLTPSKYAKLKKENKLSKDCMYIVDDIGIIDEK